MLEVSELHMALGGRRVDTSSPAPPGLSVPVSPARFPFHIASFQDSGAADKPPGADGAELELLDDANADAFLRGFKSRHPSARATSAGRGRAAIHPGTHSQFNQLAPHLSIEINYCAGLRCSATRCCCLPKTYQLP